MRLIPMCLSLLLACGSAEPEAPLSPERTEHPPLEEEPPADAQPERLAEVRAVEAGGDAGAYTLSVTVASPDEGCERYADWWEVLRPDGTLVYRRILAHSHVDEQPFTRSGGPVAIEAGDEVVVRAHMAPGGYGTQAMRGTVIAGFEPTVLDVGFAAEVASEPPQPGACAF